MFLYTDHLGYPFSYSSKIFSTDNVPYSQGAGQETILLLRA